MDTNPGFALDIIKRGRMHDLSKFEPLEFEHLWKGSLEFDKALNHHRSNNSHHPEFYANSIWGFSDLDLAEYCADCCARAQEFGTNAREYLLYIAAKKYGYITNEKIMTAIKFYIDIILNNPF